MTQIKEKIRQLNKVLPHGSKKRIAENTGINPTTVITFFQGANTSLENQKKIIKEAIKIKKEQEELYKELFS